MSSKKDNFQENFGEKSQKTKTSIKLENTTRSQVFLGSWVTEVIGALTIKLPDVNMCSISSSALEKSLES